MPRIVCSNEEPSYFKFGDTVDILTGPCNGIFLLIRDWAKGVCLINPGLREFKPLPPPDLSHPDTAELGVGFGMDTSGRFKIILIENGCFDGDDMDTTPYEMWVLKGRSWCRHMRIHPPFSHLPLYGMCKDDIFLSVANEDSNTSELTLFSPATKHLKSLRICIQDSDVFMCHYLSYEESIAPLDGGICYWSNKSFFEAFLRFLNI